MAEEAVQGDFTTHGAGRVTGKGWWTGVEPGENGHWDMSIQVPVRSSFYFFQLQATNMPARPDCCPSAGPNSSTFPTHSASRLTTPSMSISQSRSSAFCRLIRPPCPVGAERPEVWGSQSGPPEIQTRRCIKVWCVALPIPYSYAALTSTADSDTHPGSPTEQYDPPSRPITTARPAASISSRL